MPRSAFGADDRLRIVHRRRDQIVDIDVFELEDLEHLDAAGVKDLRDLRLVPLAVELGLDGIGRCHDLAECERGGEYLEQKCFH